MNGVGISSSTGGSKLFSEQQPLIFIRISSVFFVLGVGFKYNCIPVNGDSTLQSYNHRNMSMQCAGQ